jgi:hypothetical protein
MNLFDMPSAGTIVGAQALTSAAYKAIQYTRVIADRQPDSDSGEQLRKFFLQCAKFCPKPIVAEQAAAEKVRTPAKAPSQAAVKPNAADGRRSTS